VSKLEPITFDDGKRGRISVELGAEGINIWIKSEYDEAHGGVQFLGCVSRFAWPEVVKAVETLFLRATVQAQAANAVRRVLDPDP
jgi:hypothetical protein